MASISSDNKTDEELVALASVMWKEMKTLSKDNDFVSMSDEAKMEKFRSQTKYTEFMTTFPILCKYMICLNNYSKKAFMRLIKKIHMSNKLIPDDRKAGYMEDQWIRRRAYYVKFLWEESQQSHWNHKDSQKIWSSTYNILKAERDDFKNKYKDVEHLRKEEEVMMKVQNAREMLDRLVSTKHDVPEQELVLLKESLKDIVIKTRHNKCMKSITETVPIIKHSIIGFGKNKNTVQEKSEANSRNTIRMIETVRENDYDKFPSEYKM